jgi:CHAD domain-containing protein
MAVAKWFLKLSAITPPLDAARIVLEARARVVTYYLRSLANRRNEHAEQIHQLRVASRRFGAALSIFQDFLRPDHYGALRRLTRTARRSAGLVRDLDVHRALIATRLRGASHPVAELARNCDVSLGEQRASAHNRLIKITRAAAADFTSAVQRGLARLKALPTGSKRGTQRLGVMARKTLRRRLKALRTAARKNLRNWTKLHQLRIAAKRLRYAMEVFAGCFPTSFRRQLYRVVERIQEDVGRVNDLRNLVQTVKNIRTQMRRAGSVPKSTLAALKEFQRQVLSEARMYQNRFIRRWNRKAQQSFHRRVMNALNRPVARSQLRGAQLSKL